ncbi:MAG: hypothetical protein KatS3mg115_1000 [Candidatus Poribacteria bacterium]|nr:MAG: hypothetical protein KatS3mg115_1000 [Candidatus Poribacteria bacterium]
MKRLALSVAMLLTLSLGPGRAHDTWLPHHREDFQELARRKELRTTVLVITIGFALFLGGLVVYVFRSTEPARSLEGLKEEQDRLHRTVLEALSAARGELRKGDKTEIQAAFLDAYRKAAGVSALPVALDEESWQVEGDRVRIHYRAEDGTLHVEASGQIGGVSVTINQRGEISFERFTLQRAEG